MPWLIYSWVSSSWYLVYFEKVSESNGSAPYCTLNIYEQSINSMNTILFYLNYIFIYTTSTDGQKQDVVFPLILKYCFFSYLWNS